LSARFIISSAATSNGIALPEAAYFDAETVTLLRETLDDAWACLSPELQATMQRPRWDGPSKPHLLLIGDFLKFQENDLKQEGLPFS